MKRKLEILFWSLVLIICGPGVAKATWTATPAVCGYPVYPYQAQYFMSVNNAIYNEATSGVVQ
jgi:hypothetical protein